MALQFVFGNSGSGKSHYLYQRIIEESMQHPKQNYIILVPEQFTMQTQKELVMSHPRHGIMNIDVLSFARLALRVFEETGEGEKTVLDDEGKNLILRKLAGKVEGELQVLKGNIKKPGYISEIKSVISELTQYNIGPDGMDELLETAEKDSYLYYKLQDIQVMYRVFETYLADQYITKEELLDVLCGVMKRSEILKNSVIALDGFTGFTPVQNKVLREMLRCCRTVLVTVTLDEREDPYRYQDKFQLFAMSKQTIASLTRIAGEEKILIEDPVCLYQRPLYRFREHEALEFLEKELFRYENQTFEKKQNQVRIYCARNPKEEVRAAAQKIRALVRGRGYRYREIAVIASDINVYADEMEAQFQSYEIPVFLDYKRNVLMNSFVEYVRSLVAMVEQNFTYEGVFRFLRTGLTSFTPEEIDKMENYVLALGIKGYKKWQEKWIRHGRETKEEELEQLNALRVRFVELLDELVFVLKQRKKTVQDMTEALYYFFVSQKIQEKMQQQETCFTEEGELALAKEYAQIYRVVMELFDKFVTLLGEESMSLREYGELLDAGFEEAKVGVVPPSLDEVMAGDMQRSRLKDIKALLLLGANDTLIPGAMFQGGLLSERDREKFEGAGIALAPGGKEKTYIQKFYLYLHLTKPSEEVSLFYSKVSAEGKTLRPSYLIGDIRELFPRIRVFDLEEYGLEGQELTQRTGITSVIEGLQNKKMTENPAWQELYRWYLGSPKWAESVRKLVDASLYRKREDVISQEAAQQLYGPYEPSVTRLERFAACACAHFLTYGLRLKEREEYEFAALDFGNIFHRSLEHYAKKLEDGGEKWTTLSKEHRERLVEESVEESIVDYSNTVIYSSARNAYVIPRMKRMMNRTVWALTRQLEKGEFEPDAYEASFENGKIDRIDICETEDQVYVKVMDYKTGAKAFDMTAFYHGLQMQLVVYMQEALQLEEKKHPGKEVVPAGIFYYRMKDPMVEKTSDAAKLEEAILKELRLDGLVNEEDAVITRLDKEFSGTSLVIPAGRTKTGLSKASKTVTREGFEEILDFVGGKRAELHEEMQQGRTEAYPYEMEPQTGCDYCGFREICGFDEAIEGYDYHRIFKMTMDETLAKISEEHRAAGAVADKDDGKGL